ncbi:putative tRNA (guanine(26)-N(2))-dimethyltransferase [Pseudolycoriella hygida]|uniref:tRNA (guanine(26)-N(2))-dimethyltransferase n=1 Tax=Pseudolycoriella hygida TaxID=35572 RepID=A0A9Q0S5Q4_9DIPT|nr:putative tRNA (guanine(26)-N(2))-dimethyltransferase [Pseudolycoriella hygida]
MDESNKEKIKEGTAEILSEGHVFYNPVQQFNRDLSICVLNAFSKQFQKELKSKKKPIVDNATDGEVNEIQVGVKSETGLKILEALSATGLRSIRYAKEVAGIKTIVANDFSIQAVESIKQNVKNNNVDHLVVPHMADAKILMYTSMSEDKRFNVIDLDPYGSPTRFLDSAVQSVSEGGLLLITATDMAVFSGSTPEACYVKYGSIPLKTKCCHEMAIRILLHTIESTANRYGKYIKPLLSVSADFYIRVFLRIFTGPYLCKQSSSKQSLVYQCTGCDTLTLQPLGTLKPNPTASNPNQVKFGIPTGPAVNTNCNHCQHRHHMGGPIWSAPIHDTEFLELLMATIQNESLKILHTYPRIIGMLSVIREELHDVPLYYAIGKMCSLLKLEMVPVLKFRSALLHANYRVSFSHACKQSLKTDAPADVLWDILRCWEKLHPVNKDRFLKGTALKAILEKEASVEYNLVDIHADANPDSRKKALVRFPENPAAHWGPGTRSTLMISDNKMLKSIRNQNKNKKLRNAESKLDNNQIKRQKTNEILSQD